MDYIVVIVVDNSHIDGDLHSCYRLMREANIQSHKAGEKNTSANSVRRVTEVCFFHAFFFFFEAIS